ncbi:MAG: cyclic nucleotide-binding domain-containing protein [Caldilineaceae bacterium]
MNILNLLKGKIQSDHYKAGDLILRQGQQGEYMYLIQEGELDVRIDGQYVRTLGKEEIFGEMALIDGSPYSADIVAKTDCVVTVIDERRFLFLVHENPLFALHVMRIMAKRLRNS